MEHDKSHVAAGPLTRISIAVITGVILAQDGFFLQVPLIFSFAYLGEDTPTSFRDPDRTCMKG